MVNFGNSNSVGSSPSEICPELIESKLKEFNFFDIYCLYNIECCYNEKNDKINEQKSSIISRTWIAICSYKKSS